MHITCMYIYIIYTYTHIIQYNLSKSNQRCDGIRIYFHLTASHKQAAIGGGNCELTKLNETYTTDNGVTIIGTSSNQSARSAKKVVVCQMMSLSNIYSWYPDNGGCYTWI